jgi:hypothetical protein
MINDTIKVFIDPDGALHCKFGLIVLVQCPTGVRYSTQCNGINTEERSAEGFLVPVGGNTDAQPIIEWFTQQFPGVETWSADDWTDARITSLAELVRQIPIWSHQQDNDVRSFLEFDRRRVNECVEAWIPVVTPFGDGYLLTANSD